MLFLKLYPQKFGVFESNAILLKFAGSSQYCQLLTFGKEPLNLWNRSRFSDFKWTSIFKQLLVQIYVTSFQFMNLFCLAKLPLITHGAQIKERWIGSLFSSIRDWEYERMIWTSWTCHVAMVRWGCCQLRVALNFWETFCQVVKLWIGFHLLLFLFLRITQRRPPCMQFYNGLLKSGRLDKFWMGLAIK